MTGNPDLMAADTNRQRRCPEARFWIISVYDPAHQLVLRKSINTVAFAPSIAVIGAQILAPGETLDVFNPFSEFESSVPLTELEYSFCLLRKAASRWAIGSGIVASSQTLTLPLRKQSSRICLRLCGETWRSPRVLVRDVLSYEGAGAPRFRHHFWSSPHLILGSIIFIHRG
jgi:hypothetical protein